MCSKKRFKIKLHTFVFSDQLEQEFNLAVETGEIHRHRRRNKLQKDSQKSFVHESSSALEQKLRNIERDIAKELASDNFVQAQKLQNDRTDIIACLSKARWKRLQQLVTKPKLKSLMQKQQEHNIMQDKGNAEVRVVTAEKYETENTRISAKLSEDTRIPSHRKDQACKEKVNLKDNNDLDHSFIKNDVESKSIKKVCYIGAF